MGGPGSGNHYRGWRSGKKTTVEECEDLDASRWTREGILKAGVHHRGGWRWVYRGGKENSITYAVDTRDEARPFVRLLYDLTHLTTREREALDYRVRLTTTRPHFGGLRWWFVCPLVVGGVPCGRRVGKLYMPSGSRYFGCRHCHELTYESAQTHDSRVSQLRRNPALLRAILDNSDMDAGNLILALKALRD